MPLIKLGSFSLDKIKAKLMMATALYSNPLVRLILILYAKLFSFLMLNLITKNPEATSLKQSTLLWTGSSTTAAPKSTTRGPFFSRMARAKLKSMKSDFVRLSHESRNTTSSWTSFQWTLCKHTTLKPISSTMKCLRIQFKLRTATCWSTCVKCASRTFRFSQPVWRLSCTRNSVRETRTLLRFSKGSYKSLQTYKST